MKWEHKKTEINGEEHGTTVCICPYCGGRTMPAPKYCPYCGNRVYDSEDEIELDEACEMEEERRGYM